MRHNLSGLTIRKLSLLVFFGLLAGSVYAVLFVAGVDYLKLPTFACSLVAFAVSIPISFFGNRVFTFHSQNLVGPEGIRFVSVQVLNLLATSAVVHVAKEYFALSSREAVVAAFAIAGAISIFSFEFWVYAQTDLSKTFKKVAAPKGRSK